MKKIIVLIFLAGLAIILVMCRKAETFPENGYDSRLSGGINTTFDHTSKAFGSAFPGLSERDMHVHQLGDAMFGASFVRAPAPVNPGLGPLYNNVSCISCHHNDGIGLPTAGDLQSSLLMRISYPGTDAHGGPIPVPGYGGQLQDKAIFGKQPECKVNISYTYKTYSFPDGETYELRTPTYTLSNLYTLISGSYLLSPRLAPAAFGLGMLEAIPEADILANADPGDANGDQISGKPNYVWDAVTQSRQLGRFGLKCNTASILTQVATAFNQDMGLTSSVLPQENSLGQSQYISGKGYDLPDSIVNAVKFYAQTLSVPARRNVNDAVVKRGEFLFKELKCATCHIPTMTTGVNVAFPALSNQRIHPYTDMLVHDMGTGLADNRPDYEADGQEWRTTPLWGLGMFETVNYPGYYLHDGRARTIMEAVMWHDGEAKPSVDSVKKLSKKDRDALLAFLKSL